MPKKAATKKVAAKTAPRQRREGSIPDQINALQPGQSVAFTERHAVADLAVFGLDLNESLRKLRSVAHSSVSRIIDELDAREFAVESIVGLTDSKDAVIACVNVCRVK